MQILKWKKFETFLTWTCLLNLKGPPEDQKTLPSFFRMRFNLRLCSSLMLRVTLESTNTDWRSGFNLYKQTPDSLNPSQSPVTATICLVLSLFFSVFFQPVAMCHTQVFKTIILALCLFIQQYNSDLSLSCSW